MDIYFICQGDVNEKKGGFIINYWDVDVFK